MREYRVALFGHRELHRYKALEEKLCPLLEALIKTKPFVEFYMGRNGEFDIFAASVVKRAQKSFGNENSELTLVLPYPEKNMEYYEKYYDRIILPDCLQGVHPKGAITKRNRWMAETCDLLICYVEHESGGAYAAMKYAMRIGKTVINLAKG